MNTDKIRVRLRTSFALVIVSLLLTGGISLFAMNHLGNLTDKLFRHPFTVTTATLKIQGNIVRMHRAMKDVALAEESREIEMARQLVDDLERQVFKQFKIIHKRFLGEQQQVNEAEEAFTNWKPIRDEVIRLRLDGKQAEAGRITRQKGAHYVQNLERLMEAFAEFANNKANEFHDGAQNYRFWALLVNTILWLGPMLLGLWFAYTIARSMQGLVVALNSSSIQIATTVTQQDRLGTQQAAAVNETSTTMAELQTSSEQAAGQAEIASTASQKALDLVVQGVNKVQETLQGMDETKGKVEAITQQIRHLSTQTGQIKEITALVSGFAKETKMLAMNAAVEAVRAGEHGKGFSVLSIEIRKLADESKRSAERINGLIADIQKATDTTVMVTEEGTKTVNKVITITNSTAETFHEVSNSVQHASDNAQQISMNVRQQAVATKQVLDAMQSLDKAAKENANGINQIKQGIEALNQIAQNLRGLM